MKYTVAVFLSQAVGFWLSIEGWLKTKYQNCVPRVPVATIVKDLLAVGFVVDERSRHSIYLPVDFYPYVGLSLDSDCPALAAESG